MLHISSSTINKLGHEIPEIRSRALKYIEGKLKRSLNLNEELIFNPGNVIKHLIRWFGQKPLYEEERVLKIILIILQSKYGGEAVHYLTKDRFFKEINKIDKIIQSQHSKALLFEIIDILNEYESREDTCSLNKSDRKEPSFSGISSSSDILLDETSDYEMAWSVPSAPDFNSLKLLSESLTVENENDLQHAFNYLEAAINDYPAEYFLQPPYIFNSLLVLTKKEIIKSSVLLNILINLTKSFSGRIKKKQLAIAHSKQNENNQYASSNTQITPKRYCSVLFNICIDYYKKSSETPNEPPPSKIYALQKEILEVISIDLQSYNFRNTILVDLGNLARYYRRLCSIIDPSNSLNRLLYIYMLQLIVEILSIESKKNIQLVPSATFRKSNYNPEIYMSTSTSTNNEKENLDVWMSELECAAFDFPLKEIHPELYKRIKLFANISEKKKLKALLNCEESVGPVVNIIKQCQNISKEVFIVESYRVLDTILFINNTEMVTSLLHAIFECTPRLAGNKKLRDCAERSLLKLLCHENLQIQKTTYKVCSDKVKLFVAEAMNGEVAHKDMLVDMDDRIYDFGMPLTAAILYQIICHGYSSGDISVKASAEIILILLLKMRPILYDAWQGILDILLPSIPLLQALITDGESSLSPLLLRLFDPEEKSSGVNLLEQLKGNLRFLFSKGENIRKNALSRIIYMVSTQSTAENWIPNVLQMSDTVLDNICILGSPRHSEKMFTTGLYERSTILALLELLRSPNVEPTIRKTTLLQLNVMCQDPDLAELIHDQDGWALILEALDNSLKKNGCVDYPDAAIPAIGIICKIVLCCPDYRRELSKQIDIYFLLIRSLFAFPCEDIFKTECVLLLFLLTFSSILVGSISISIPEMCRELEMPIVCKLISQKNEHTQKTPLEQAYSELITDAVHSPRSNHSTDFHLDVSRINDNVVAMRDCMLRFMRLQFAISWCGGVENLLSKSITISNSNSSSASSMSSLRKRSDKEKDDLLLLSNFLKHSPELLLKTSDIDSIKSTSADENVKHLLYDVANAISHDQVVESVHKINLCITISKKISTHQQKNILNTFKRYLMTTPNNSKDVTLFIDTIFLLVHLIDEQNNHMLFLILSELKSRHCLFLSLLKNTSTCIRLYKTNCKFLQVVTKCCIYYIDQKAIQSCLEAYKSSEKSNLYNILFESALKVAEECFRQRDIDRFRTLLNLLQFLSASRSMDFDDGFSMSVVKKLIDFIIKLKSFTQTGSHLNKNALLITRNIIEDMNEVILEEKYLKCLSGIGGHQDFEIRTMSWCIFEKISRSLKGSHSLIKALSYLPDGFHGCCISVLLDVKEIPLVRATAGGVFSNLLAHTKEYANGKRLNMSVAPLSCTRECIEADDGLRALELLLRKHRLYDRIDETLNIVYLSDVIFFNTKDNITTCGIIKIYCSIISNLIELYPGLLDKYFEFSCFDKLFRLIKSIPLCISESSIDMLAGICHLLAKFLQVDDSLILNFNSRDRSYVKVLFQVLDWNIYEKSPTSFVQIVQFLKVVAKETISYSSILNNLAEDINNNFFNFVFHALLSKNILIQHGTLDFIKILIVKCQTEIYNFSNFVEIIERTEPINLLDIIASNKIKKLNFEKVKIKYVSDFLLVTLNVIFTTFECNLHTRHSCDRQQLLSTCSETLAVFLKCSSRARVIANRINFLDYLLGKLEKVFEDMGMSCTDFIRKYGDAKKLPIIEEFIFVFEIILNWYYEDSLIDERQIHQFAKICLQTWPWINHSTELRNVFITTLAFLSENSISVCKQFSTTVSGQSCTIVQQLISLLVQETMKTRSSQIDTSLLEIGIRALSNCCSCIEGRMQCMKFHALDIFNKFHPSITKFQKSWNQIIVLWLNFWEIFSRYPEGAGVKHMHLLGMLSAKSTPEIRNKCLVIVRNMAFVNSNRAALCSSEDFLYIAKSTLSDGSRAEQLLVLVAIWKLIAGNCKAKHAIRATSIPNKIKKIQNEILNLCSEDDNEDLLNVLEILNNILE